MKVDYDDYYQTESLFGEPYPALIDFYASMQPKGTLLDLGCGQGRDAIALAKLGYEVTGIDHSQVGINQLNAIAQKGELSLKGLVGDVYAYSRFKEFDFILLNSMFHFGKKDKAREIGFLQNIIESVKPNTHITICIQDSGNKVHILDSVIAERKEVAITLRKKFVYAFEDQESGHRSESNYQMLTIQKKL